MTYMLDTNICIYAMKNKPEQVLQRLKKELNSGVCISSITLAELEYGMKHSSNPIKMICTPFTGHPVEGVLLCGTHMSTKGNV